MHFCVSLEPTTGIEPVTSSLPRKCSTTELCGRHNTRAQFNLERVMGIEPTLSAWKAEVLPLNYTRTIASMVEGEGFEPSKPKQQIYSLPPLTTREPLPKCKHVFFHGAGYKSRRNFE